MAELTVSSGTFTVEDALEHIGFGRTQVIMFLFVGIAWAGDGMEMMLLSYLGPEVCPHCFQHNNIVTSSCTDMEQHAVLQLKCKWDLTPAQESWITSVVFIGMMIGSYSWGAISDRYGRKIGYFAPAVFTAAFGILSATAPNYGVRPPSSACLPAYHHARTCKHVHSHLKTSLWRGSYHMYSGVETHASAKVPFALVCEGVCAGTTFRIKTVMHLTVNGCDAGVAVLQSMCWIWNSRCAHVDSLGSQFYDHYCASSSTVASLQCLSTHLQCCAHQSAARCRCTCCIHTVHGVYCPCPPRTVLVPY